MAKKSGSKRGGKRSGKRESPPAMPNPQLVEKAMAQVTRLLSEHDFESIEEANAYLQKLVEEGMLEQESPEPETPLGQAQELMYEAWSTEAPQKRLQLARKALKISPDCADAYLLLAEESAQSIEEAHSLYEQALQAGERAIGPEAFEEYAGDFWGIIETRPYMRAREALAVLLWEMGEHEAAIEHFKAMLALNPEDNQGIRYVLLTKLMSMDRTQEVDELLTRYEEDNTAAWLFTRALFLYQREGEKRKAKAQLRKAMKQNPHVADYMLGRQRMPPMLPPYVGFGDEAEAEHYMADSFYLWLRTPGAIEWARKA